MNVSIHTVEGCKIGFDKAADKFESEKAAMFRPDGKRIWADVQHDERIASMLETVTRAAANVKEEVDAAIEQAKAIEVLAHADPMQALTNDELQRAYFLRPFVIDSVDSMSLIELADRLAAVVATGSRGEQACYYQAAYKRTEALKEASRGKATLDGVAGSNSTVNLEGISAVSEHLKTLASKLVDPKVAKQLQEAAALKKTALEVSMATNKRVRELDGSNARAQQTVTDFYRNNF